MNPINLLPPDILTLITTYKCSAACRNCCFSCSPNYSKTMSIEDMRYYIKTSITEFPSIQVVVFTGGECTLLKDDLLRAIEWCKEHKLITRIVSNGYWATTEEKTIRMVNRLAAAGLDEINISTGKDHMQYIPLSNVCNVIKVVSLNSNIQTVAVAIEEREDYAGNDPYYILYEEYQKMDIARQNKIILLKSPWMNFKERKKDLNSHKTNKNIRDGGGCSNLFKGIQINPNGQLLACCGLSCEYSPFLKLGEFSDKLCEIYNDQFKDLLKIWLFTEGPLGILRYITGNTICSGKHDCDYCLDLLTNDTNIRKLLGISSEKAKDIMIKFNIKLKVESYEKEEITKTL